MIRKITSLTLTLLVGIFMLTFVVGCSKDDYIEPHQYGQFIGVAANHDLTDQCFIDKVWIENNINWNDVSDEEWFGVQIASGGGFMDFDASAPAEWDGRQSDHTVTNIQVEGVLEGDIVQVDGTHIYFLSHTGLTIINAGRRMSVVYRDDFENFLPDEMYIFGNLLVVIGGYFSSINLSATLDVGQRWGGVRQNTVIKLYDISDRDNVLRLERHSISGTFITSRLIDDQLVVLTNHWINRRNIDTILPIINGEPIDLGYVHIHDTGSLGQHIVLASLNLVSRNLLVASHFGIQIGWSGSAQYFSAEYVYFFNGATATINERGDTTRYTYLKKISLSTLLLTAQTTFYGWVNDRFWVSEHNGNLRVFAEAFSSGRGNLGRHTNLFVFDQNLSVIADKSPIAIGQSIHAVRFRGDIAAIDTYILIHIRIDSVSRVDLSDLANITITEGEPEHGVNEYLHFISDDLVIGLGFDTQTVDRFSSFRGIKVTLYENVDGSFEIINSFTLGINNGASSEAISNPKAILADPARNMFSIPILMRGPQVNFPRISLDGQGLAVFEYVICPNGNHEFIYRGLLSNLPQNHTFVDSQDFAYHSLSFVQRGVRIADRIYTISDRYVTSYCANTLREIQRLTLTLNICSILGCDEVVTTVRPTTCQTDGLFRARCRRCGTVREWTQPAWGQHRFTPWVVTTVPSLNNPGQETRRCLGNCGTVEVRNLDRHSFVNGLLLRFDDDLDGYAVRAFMGSQTTVVIPEYLNGVPVVAIDEFAFNVAHNDNVSVGISTVEIAANVRYIGPNAFGSWRSGNTFHQLSQVRFAPESQLTTIDQAAFEWTRISTISLPDSLIEIGDNAFLNTNLTSVTLPDGLKHIGHNAFANTRLTGIHIPASVLVIGSNAFRGLIVAANRSALASVTFAPNSQLREIQTGAFSNSSITSVVIPASVEIIGNNAFAQGGWETISLLSSLTFEDQSRLRSIGPNAFARARISEVSIPASVLSIGASAFSDNPFLTQVLFAADSSLTQIGASAFRGTSLTNVVLPDSLEEIGSTAFSNTNLETIVIPQNVSSIGFEAFFDANLISAFIPASVTSIGSGAFASNPRLSNLAIDPNNEYYQLIDNALVRIATNTLVAGSNQAKISDGIVVIERRALHNMGLVGTLVIPTSVVEIRSNALSANALLTEIYIQAGSNLEIIFSQAFADNRAVTNINLENARNLINIQTGAFARMTSVLEIIIPDNVWRIEPWAFQDWLATQTVMVEAATNTLEATIRLGVNWMSGSQMQVIYLGE